MVATVLECVCSPRTGALCMGHRAMRDAVSGRPASTYRTLCDLTHVPSGETHRVHLHCAESGARRMPSIAAEFTVAPVDAESSADCGMTDCPARPSYLGW